MIDFPASGDKPAVDITEPSLPVLISLPAPQDIEDIF